MSGARTPLDLSLPFVVASQDLAYGPKRFVRGEAFPWRDLGVLELDLLQLYTFFKVDCIAPVTADAAVGEKRSLKLDDGRTVVVTASERVHVETPKQKRQRAAQRTD